MDKSIQNETKSFHSSNIAGELDEDKMDDDVQNFLRKTDLNSYAINAEEKEDISKRLAEPRSESHDQPESPAGNQNSSLTGPFLSIF